MKHYKKYSVKPLNSIKFRTKSANKTLYSVITFNKSLTMTYNHDSLFGGYLVKVLCIIRCALFAQVVGTSFVTEIT